MESTWSPHGIHLESMGEGKVHLFSINHKDPNDATRRLSPKVSFLYILIVVLLTFLCIYRSMTHYDTMERRYGRQVKATGPKHHITSFEPAGMFF
jgi:hypothetical protein